MALAAVGLKLPESYKRFGSDVVNEFGFRSPPSDLAPSILLDGCFDYFEDLIINDRDNAVAGLALMWMIGRFGTCTLEVHDAKA